MSLKVTQLVWKARLPSTQKLVAARLADFADDDGGRVFPSNARVAEDCGLSERSVRDTMRALEAAGVLVLVALERPGQNLPREYRLDLTVLVKLSASDESRGQDVPPGTTFRPAPDAARQETAKRGAGRAPDPLDNHQEGVEGSARPHPINPAVEIIAAFDAERSAAFGPEQARGWPHSTDKVHADRWLSAGADLDLCRGVFRHVCQQFAGTGRAPPGSLSFFDQRISNALADRNRPMPEGRPNVHRPVRETVEQATDRRRSALAGAVARRMAASGAGAGSC